MAQPPAFSAILPVQGSNGTPFSEDYGYLAGIIRAFDGTEQRYLQKQRPRRGFALTLSLVDPADVQALLPVLYANLDSIWAVPLWPYASKLTADWTSGSAVASCSTIGMPLAAGDHGMVWKDRLHYDTRRVVSSGFTSVTLSSVGSQTIASGAGYYVPMYPAHFSGPPAVNWLSGEACEIDLQFAGEDWIV